MKIKCIIIEDEPPARDLLEHFISKVDYLELSGSYSSPINALSKLKQESIDLIFLDIMMPEMTGLEFLDSSSQNPDIILTTAYDNFAVESYNYGVLDYLLKPFSFPRFLKSVDKIVSNIPKKPTNAQGYKNHTENSYLFINYNSELINLNFDDIHYIQGFNDYIIIKTTSKKFIIKDNLKDAEELLKSCNFIRVHRSYIVNIKKIEKIINNIIEICGEEIPIGRIFKTQFFNLIKRNKLG